MNNQRFEFVEHARLIGFDDILHTQMCLVTSSCILPHIPMSFLIFKIIIMPSRHNALYGDR
jgi:hypothetical protein